MWVSFIESYLSSYLFFKVKGCCLIIFLRKLSFLKNFGVYFTNSLNKSMKAISLQMHPFFKYFFIIFLQLESEPLSSNYLSYQSFQKFESFIFIIIDNFTQLSLDPFLRDFLWQLNMIQHFESSWEASNCI